MKSLSLKKAALLLIGMNCFMFIKTEQQHALSSVEKNNIDTLIRNVEVHVLKFQTCITNFITKNDGESYRAYVDRLSAYLDDFERNVLIDLQNKLSNAGNQQSSYYKGLSIVHEVLIEVIARFKSLRTVLMQYRDKDASQATALAKALERTALSLVDSSTLKLLTSKVDELENVIKNTGDRSLISRLESMKKAFDSLSGSGAPKVSKTTIFACLSRRLRKNRG